MKNGKFNTDAGALNQRIITHKKYALYDLNRWIFEHFDLIQGLSILDIGCGTGKQTLPMAETVGDSGHILAVDISQDALDELFQSAKELNLEKRIKLLHIGIDDIERYSFQKSFDRALACYSLYYSERPQTVFEVVHNILKNGGIFFFCGPSGANNSELKRFHFALLGEEPPVESGASVFMEETGQQLARDFFTEVEVFTFKNPLHFDSADALYTYWSSYNLYDRNLDDEFKAAADKYFQKHNVFETIKCVVGIKTTT